MEARGEERFGPWRLGRRIAAGTLAEVAEARRVGFGSDGPAPRIALKRLHGHVARDPDVAALFAAECALTARGVGSHPHLVRGLEIGEVEGRPFLAMALVA